MRDSRQPLKAYRFLVAGQRLFSLFLRGCLGAAIGLAVLEGILRVNPGLLLRGMALPAPVDAPITTRDYDIYNSDADLFFWSPELVRPIAPQAKRVEVHVHYETDEFGFPNAAPLSPTVDVVVLGRSYSMGAQATDPWPRQLERATGWRVLNLSQQGSGIDIKYGYWRDFAAPRRPRWVILETLPSMDIWNYSPAPSLLVQGLPVPLIQQFAREKNPNSSERSGQIYPLKVDIPGRQVELTFFFHYLSALSINRDTMLTSSYWSRYKQIMTQLVEAVRSESACVALLYVPTKENIYFPLAVHPVQLEAVLASLLSVQSTAKDSEPKTETPLTISSMQKNADVARGLVGMLAMEYGAPFIDPTERLTQSALSGIDPFMSYDTHWSAAGHRIVSDLVAETLSNHPCSPSGR